MLVLRVLFVALLPAGVLFLWPLSGGLSAQEVEPREESPPTTSPGSPPAFTPPAPAPASAPAAPASTRRFAAPTYPDDWSDLFEEDRDIYGSEKEEKYDVNAMVVEIENWPGHYSRKILWLYRYTNYPRYKSTRFFPFYYHLKSKGDNRQKTLSPIYYNKIEGRQNYSAIWPLLPFPIYVWGKDEARRGSYHGLLPFYYSRDNSGGKNGFGKGHLSWSWGHYLHERKESDGEHSTFFAPLLPLYFSWKQPGETHRNLLYLIDWKRDDRGKLKRLIVFPFLFHRPDRKNDPGYTYSPLYFRGGDPRDRYFLTWGYYRSREFTSLYTSGPRDQGGGYQSVMRETRVTPFTYSKKVYRTPAGVSSKKIEMNPARYRTQRPIEEVSAYSVFFIPFYRRARTQHYNSLLAGPYYTRTETHSKEKTTHFVPFYYGRDRKHERLRYYSLFYVIPLHYSNKTKSGTSRYSGLVYYRSHDEKGQLQKSWFVPLWFYKRNSYFSIPLALWFSSKKTDSKGKVQAASSWIGPVHNSYDKRSGRVSNWVVPFYFGNKNKNYTRKWSWVHYHYTAHPAKADNNAGGAQGGGQTEQHLKSRAYGLFPPLLPLYYYKETSKYTSTNVAWLYYRKSDRKGNTLKRRVAPFYFYNRDPKTKRESWVIPPVSRSKNPQTGERTLHVWPVYFSWHKNFSDPDRDIVHGKTTVANPLWYYKSEQTIANGRNVTRSKRWVPILPLIYSSEDDSEKGSYRRVLNTYWTKGTDGKTKKRAFMPFYWHNLEPGGYLHVFPFYHRPQSKDPQRGLSYGFLPPFYHRWSPGKDTFYLLNYYSSRDDKRQKARTVFFPIVFKSKDGIKRRELIIPYKYEYEDEDEYYRFILGVSLNQQFGLLKPSLSFGQRGEDMYFDTETAVLFNLFSFEKRISFPTPSFLKSGDQKSADRKAVEKLALKTEAERLKQKTKPPAPKLVRKFIWNKDDYRDYWGWSALFGMAAYKKADGVNHFRILPLYWFTWHENNSEGVTTVPGFYLNYKGKDTRYFFAGLFLLPIYAHQSVGESYTNIYPLFTWISSYDAKRKVRKQKALFGLAGWSSGEKESGSYVFPVYYHNRKTVKNVTTRRTFFPIYYSRNRTTALAGGGQLHDDLSWSIAHYHRRSTRIRKTREGQRLETRSKTFGPLYYKRVKESRPLSASTASATSDTTQKNKDQGLLRDSTLFLLGYYKRETPDETFWSAAGLVNSGKNKKTKESSFSILFGLLGSSSRPGSGRTKLLPFYYSSTQVSGKAGQSNYYKEVNRLVPLALWYNYQRKESNAGPDKQIETHHWNLLYDYDRYQFKKRSSWSLWVPFVPIFYYGKGDQRGRTHNVLMGLAYHYHHYKPTKTTSHSSLWSLAKVSYGPDRFEARLLPLFSYQTRDRTSAGAQKNKFHRTRWWIFPLAYYKNEHSTFQNGQSSETTHLNWLYYWNREIFPNGNYRKKLTVLPFLPVVYYKDEKHIQGRDRGTGRPIVSRATTRWAMPFYYSNKERLAGKMERESFWLFPYYSSTNHNTKSRTHFVLPGIYWKTTPTYKRRNYAYLFDTVRDDAKKFSATRALFGAVSYERTPEEYKFSLFYRGLYGIRYKNANDYDRNILWGIASRKGKDYHNSFVPLWYYDREGESKTFSVLWPMWYQSSTPARDLEYAGAGLLWFKRYDKYERSGIALAGLGLAYIGSQKPERDYHSQGVFWNLIWQHQYEKENRFKKTSILKGIIYSKVTDQHGNSWKRIMGVKFGYKKAERQ